MDKTQVKWGPGWVKPLETPGNGVTPVKTRVKWTEPGCGGAPSRERGIAFCLVLLLMGTIQMGKAHLDFREPGVNPVLAAPSKPHQKQHQAKFYS
jgi:hypothetical protein